MIQHPGAIVIALAERARVTASFGEERTFALGTVVVSGSDPRGVLVVLHLKACDGRAKIAMGQRWGAEEPVWSDDLRMEERAFAVPLAADESGDDLSVEVLVRVRPLLPSRSAWADVSAYAHLPGGGP